MGGEFSYDGIYIIIHLSVTNDDNGVGVHYGMRTRKKKETERSGN